MDYPAFKPPSQPQESKATISRMGDIPDVVLSSDIDQQAIPFPSVGQGERAHSASSFTRGQGGEQNEDNPMDASMSTSPDSQATSSSKQTSSDKLSALPMSAASSPNTNKHLRSPTITTSSKIRGFRRSLDASASLPSFATADLESPPLGNVWNTVHNLHSHLTSSATFPRIGDDTPPKRVSFESERGSVPTTTRQHMPRKNRGSDPTIPSPALRSSAYASHRESQKDTDSPNIGSRSPSNSRSRAASPLRMFQQWSAGLHRSHRTAEEPFVPIDPFKLKTQLRFPRLSSLVEHTHHDLEHGSTCNACVTVSSTKPFVQHARVFLSDTLPRQMYLNLLLRLPAMYFSRVARIFEDAEVSRPDIQRMIDTNGGRNTFMSSSTSEPAHVGAVELNDVRNSPEHPPRTLSPTMAAGIGLIAHIGAAAASSVGHVPLPFPDEWTPPLVSPALIRFKLSWEAFIDSLLREWKTLNVVSALLLSAILTMFQIPSAEGDPVTRNAALLSLVCALMSLSYGCVYIVRFGTMRSMYRASKWAEEARKTNTLIWWNVWVFLAMPAVWLAWSMVLFIVSILSFLWRTGSELDPEEPRRLGARASLGPRIAVTAVFALGMVYFAMIVKTLRSYGTHVGGMGSRMSRAAAEQRASNLREREIEAAMSRRGRVRERTVSNTRRREEAPERGRGSAKDGDSIREKSPRNDRGEPRSTMGLGLVGLSSRGLDSGIGLEREDVEKLETLR
ncbi:hypothetical protein BDZ94DRAFT_1256944 [Collybia nuda]|uniref:Uncharacterized protein n=1 Tax=Collybia nuda TaxID=64659 RepID=A0A9P6CL24_9AGAR|nr:hypothetical protein BDZ94DRAFT_1256944 [Collybia nuda]